MAIILEFASKLEKRRPKQPFIGKAYIVLGVKRCAEFEGLTKPREDEAILGLKTKKELTFLRFI